MNTMLSNKLVDMKKELTDNGVTFDSDDEKEEEMIREFNRMHKITRLAGSPHPSSNPLIHYPPISAKKMSQPRPFSKISEIGRIKRTSTVEKINQSRYINDGSMEIDRSRAETLRKQNRLANLIKMEVNDPYKAIEIKGSNLLGKLPPYKSQAKPNNSSPRVEYKKEDGLKEELPMFQRGKLAFPKGQENLDVANSLSVMGIQGAGIHLPREVVRPFVGYSHCRLKVGLHCQQLSRQVEDIAC